MTDEQIVDLYNKRSEDALSETEKKYARYCRYIAFSILGDEEDAKEVVNDTYLRVWNSIPPQCPRSLKAYLGTVARHLSLDYLQKKQSVRRGGGQYHLALEELEECIPDSSDDLNASIALQQILNRFLGGLPRKTRDIFVRRYWYMSPIAEIAKDYSMGESGVKMLLHRTRNKLKEYLKKEGFFV